MPCTDLDEPSYFLLKAYSLAPSAGESWQRHLDPAEEGTCRNLTTQPYADGSASASSYTDSLPPARIIIKKSNSHQCLQDPIRQSQECTPNNE